jgi:pimeloyl-ACP methyl ester carboxylesterase
LIDSILESMKEIVLADAWLSMSNSRNRDCFGIRKGAFSDRSFLQQSFHPQLYIVPGCGHLSTMEQPDAVSETLRAWLDL